MNDNFNINIYSNDANFCASLALECNNYGFSLTFFEKKNMELIFNNYKNFISVIIIDLSSLDQTDPFKLGQKARMISDFPVFGVLNRFNKKDQDRAKKSGFDLIFTKKMLLRSIKDVVIHIADNE